MLADCRGGIQDWQAQLFGTLAVPNRIAILYALSNGPSNICDLAEVVDLPHSIVSWHLKMLRESGIVLAAQKGRSMIYQLSNERVIGVLDLLRGILKDNLAKKAVLANTISEH